MTAEKERQKEQALYVRQLSGQKAKLFLGIVISHQ